MDINSTQEKMDVTLDHFQGELKKIRTGRANPQMVEGVMVEVYGQMSPLPHIATINAVDAQMLQITPFDPNNLDAISAAIRNDSSLGLNPADDGKVVRVPIPALTTERREQIVKQVSEKAEEARISLRNTRHDFMDTNKKAEKAGDITKDDLHGAEKSANDLIDQYQTKIDELSKAKEAELMQV